VRLSWLGREEYSHQFVDEQLRLTATINKISQHIASQGRLDQILSEMIEHIVADYDAVYHTQVFMVDDERDKAALIASTGDEGRALLSQRYSVKVDRQSPVGIALIDGVAAVERHTALEGLQQARTYLPQTRIQAVLPLLVGGKVIGALDLHSKAASAFGKTELANFQIIADYAAIVIHNAALVDGTQQQLEANRALVDQTQSALQQVEELNSRLTGQAWSVFLETSQLYRGIDVDFEADETLVNEDWTDNLQAAARANALLEAAVEDGHVIAVPVRVRGQVVGAMEFELDADPVLTDSDLELINEVSQRFGLAAENARLYEESRRMAQREALINEAGARLQASSNVEKTLIEAARSVQEILKVNRVAIQLGEPPAAQSNGHGKDSA
jgi:GAF domain-containing protein